MPSITKINELDCKIQGNFNRLDSSMHKIVKTLETIKFHDLESSRIDKIEEVINTLGTNFSQSKSKRKKLRQKRNPSPSTFPRFLEPKNNPPIAKGVETVKTLEEIPILNKFINETPIDLPPLDFIPRSIFIRSLFEKSY